MNDGLDRNEKRMLAISPNKGVKSKALGKKTGYKTALGAVKSKTLNALNMHFSESDIRGQKEVSDANRSFRKKHTHSPN